MNRMQYPKTCQDCEEFEACPYPDLMTLMKQLSKEKFEGDVSIYFRDGLPSKVSKFQTIEFVRR